MARGRLLKSTKSARRTAGVDWDPLVAAAEDWQAKRSKLDALILEWQGLEDKLAREARALRVSLADACEGEMREAQLMRALDREIESVQRMLAARLLELRRQRSKTLAGAIAKVSLGLKVQGAYDWQDSARELIEGGVAELRMLTDNAVG